MSESRWRRAEPAPRRAGIRRHRRSATLLGCGLLALALWALLPSPLVRVAAAAGSTTSDLEELLEDCQAIAADVKHDLTRMPRSWCGLPSGVSERFELVLPDESGFPRGVLDHLTGLTWHEMPRNEVVLYVDAIILAGDARVSGTGGWRLPTVDEFMSILQRHPETYRFLPHPDFPGRLGSNVSGMYWTQTETDRALTPSSPDIYDPPPLPSGWAHAVERLYVRIGVTGDPVWAQPTFADDNGHDKHRVWLVRGPGGAQR